MTVPTLQIENLKTHFHIRDGVLKAVDGVDFMVEPGQIVGLVGESGCGKSVLGFSIMGLVDPPGRVVDGRIYYKGRNITGLGEEAWRRLRGNRIAMVFQDPMMTLNPVLSIETQMLEAVLAHNNVKSKEACRRACDALSLVGIPKPEERLKSYPHQFSGGMRQRVAIAIAMLNNPDLIIADEPTTALDVTIQGQILHEVKKLCNETGTSMIWITHDLGVVAGLAHSINVMYAGQIVEKGSVDDLLDSPMHPYTVGLLNSVPGRRSRHRRLFQIPGMTPSLFNLPKGCAFKPRCSNAKAICDSVPKPHRPNPNREIRCFHPFTHGGDIQ